MALYFVSAKKNNNNNNLHPVENILENDNLKKKTYQVKMKTEIFLQQT